MKDKKVDKKVDKVAEQHEARLKELEVQLKEHEVRLKAEDVRLKESEVKFKEAEIKYKELEVKCKKEDLDDKKLDVLRKTFEVDAWERKTKHNESMDKIMFYNFLMQSCVVDEDTTIGSEVRYKSPFEEYELKGLKNKLLKLTD